MTEVSPRAGSWLIEILERAGVEPAELVAGLPISLEGLVAQRFEWDLFTQLLERAAALRGGVEPLEASAREFLSSRSFTSASQVFALAAGTRDLFRRGHTWFGRTLFMIVRDRYEEPADGVQRVTLEIPDGYRDSPVFFHLMRGALSGTPRLFGQPDARVDMTLSPRCAVYTIHAPRPGRWALLRVLLRRAPVAEGVDDWLNAQQRQLRESYDRLQAAYDELSRARDGLEVRVQERTAELSLANEALRKEVAEREAAQSALSKLMREGQLILDSVSDGIYGIDRLGIVTFINPAAARALGGKPRDFVGRLQHEAIRHADPGGAPCPGTGCGLEGVLERDVSRAEGIKQLWRIDGTTLSVECVSTPLRERERVVGAVVAFRDISRRLEAERERRELEAQLWSAQKLESLGVMAGGIAHDFNNLLAVIVGQTSLALEDLPADSPSRPNVERALTAARRAGDLTRQLLVFVGGAASQYRPVRLNELIQENVHLFAAALPRNVALHPELAAGLPPIEADPGQLQQVVMNLILNGAEAIGTASGTVRVSTSVRRVEEEARYGPPYGGEPLAPGRYVVLEVRDDGEGIASEKLDKIFDPFFTTKFTGRGLGLSAVLGIARTHGGAVDVASEPGRGTAFRVLLPARDDLAAPETPAPEAPDAEVLVVDDDEAVRMLIREALERAGFAVRCAADGRRGLELYRERAEHIGVAVLDLSMPGLDGDETLRELRKLDPELPVILTSGYSGGGARRRLQRNGRTAYLPKPFGIDELVDEVRELLD